MQKNPQLLQNPSYLKLQRLASYIPFDLRQTIKAKKIPFILNEFLKWVLVDAQRPKYFHPYGLQFFCGLPGKGKTIFMTRQLAQFREKYGRSILIGTNYGFKYEDFKVTGYEDIIKIRNKPCIIGYDEIQNDFDSRNWANLDHAFSERITQSRKMEGLMIFATAQKFGFVDKRLRQLTNLVYQCDTFFNRWTLARIYEPVMIEKIEDGFYQEFNKKVSKGFKMFIQTDFLREMYNSYQILEGVRDKLHLEDEQRRKVIHTLDKILSDTGRTPI